GRPLVLGRAGRRLGLRRLLLLEAQRTTLRRPVRPPQAVLVLSARVAAGDAAVGAALALVAGLDRQKLAARDGAAYARCPLLELGCPLVPDLLLGRRLQARGVYPAGNASVGVGPGVQPRPARAALGETSSVALRLESARVGIPAASLVGVTVGVG